jgi:hypothetical protein
MTQQIQSTQETTTDALQVARSLRSGDEAIRREAEAAAFSGEKESIEILIATARQENAKKPLRFAVALGVIMATMIVVSSVISMLLHVQLTGVVSGFIVAALGGAAAYAPTPLQKRVMQALSEIDDVRAVGPLIEALDRQDASTARAAAGALIRLLPRLRPGDANALSDRQRAILNEALVGGVKTLDRAAGVQLAVAGLTALMAVGDGCSLPHVRRLAAGRGMARKNPEIQRAAEDLLPVLEIRQQAERLRETLLRPASPAPRESLLRAVASGTEPDAFSLLRAAPAATDPADSEAN